MFGFRKAPAAAAEKPPRQTSIDPSNPLDSDDDSPSDKKKTMGRRTSSEPALITPDESDLGRGRNKQKDYDSMSVQELESYAVNQAEETTNSVKNCLKIAEDIRGDASKTLETLHAQGEQIHRTHVMAADMDKDLTKACCCFSINPSYCKEASCRCYCFIVHDFSWISSCFFVFLVDWDLL